MYHNDKIIDEYNLSNLPSYYKLLNLSDTNIEGDNINYLNPYLCELCGYYYIWKNNIYSPYVGFCHYRRLYVDLGLDNLEKYEVYYPIENSIKIQDYYKDELLNENDNLDKLYEYLCTLKQFNNDELYNLFYNDKQLNTPWKISGIFKWEHFIKICEIIFGFLEYISPNYKDIDIHKDYYRKLAWQFELYFGIIVGIYFNNIKMIPNYINFNTIILSQSNNINNIVKFAKNNCKCGSLMYIISDKFTQDDLDKYYENLYIINNINEIPEYLNNSKIIKLKIGQYIDTLDPISFIQGKYTIQNK